MTDTLAPPSAPVVWLPIASLRIDPNINRPLDRHRVETIAREFDPDAVGVLTISAREDGSYIVLDGQHRLAALRRAGFTGEQQVPCDVRRGLTQAQEAGLFVKLNNSAKPHYYHRFLRRVTAGDPVATAVRAIAAEAGFEISDQRANGHINAVAAMERIYLGAGAARATGPHPDVLAGALAVLSAAFGHTADAVNGQLIEGVGLLLTRYGPALDRTNLIYRLSKVSGGANGLLARGKGIHDLKNTTVPGCVATVCVDIYNHSKRSRRLDDWQ